MSEKLTVSFVEELFRNEENGYAVALFTGGDDEITVTGVFPELSDGEVVEFWGQYTNHPRYGRQFKAERFDIRPPTTLSGIEKYLGSGLIKGVGPAMARQIVATFGEDTLTIMTDEPDRLLEIRGIGEKKKAQIIESFAAQAASRRTMLFLRGYGITAVLSKRIEKAYGDQAERLIRENPYRLIDDIKGVGFLTADRIAQSLGQDPESAERVAAGIKHILGEAAQQHGHCFLPRETLEKEAARLLAVPLELAESVLLSLQLERDVIVCFVEGDRSVEAVYLPYYWYAERDVARRLATLLGAQQQLIPGHAAQQIAAFEDRNGVAFSGTQKDAILSAAEQSVFIITGGPGTGKTTIINCLIEVLGDPEGTMLAAPTGRAAKRMSEATGRQAMTIHRLLEYAGDDNRFNRDEDNPLTCSCLIVDEMSMVDILMMHSLLKALRPPIRLIMVGDQDQLPSVGPGHVLGDLIQSGLIPTAKLTDIFRQEAESLIVENAHRINCGQWPVLNQKDSDFFFESCQDAQQAADQIVRLAIQRLPKFLKTEDPLSAIQVLSPSRMGACGVNALNRMLQQAMNPQRPHANEIIYNDMAFRAGDKVMHIKNNYQLSWIDQEGNEGQGVFNGDIGTITRVSEKADGLEVLFDDQRRAWYEYALLEEMTLAYCLSVHKSQGSEFPCVVMPIVGGNPFLHTRNLLYTAVTRARTLVVLIGREEALHQMIRNNRQTVRHTGLHEALLMMPGLTPFQS